MTWCAAHRRSRLKSRPPATRSRCTATPTATCCAARHASPPTTSPARATPSPTPPGRVPRWFRPPFGILSFGALRAAKRLQLRTVLWTTWGRDWRREATPESVEADVLRRYVDGGTVLLHDSDCTSYPGSWRSALGALPRLGDDFAARGLAVGPVGEHGLGSTPTDSNTTHHHRRLSSLRGGRPRAPRGAELRGRRGVAAACGCGAAARALAQPAPAAGGGAQTGLVARHRPRRGRVPPRSGRAARGIGGHGGAAARERAVVRAPVLHHRHRAPRHAARARPGLPRGRGSRAVRAGGVAVG